MLNTKILVLNYDYTVLGFTTFRRALPKILYDKVFIEEFSDNSVRDVIIPRVIRVKQYVQRKYKRQDFGTSLRRLIYKRDSYVCTYCRKPIYSKRELSLDHIVPKSKGGSDLYNNLVTSCVKCNNKKR
jgi:5-methylcytosine-specific restriction endonuclease McrA